LENVGAKYYSHVCREDDPEATTRLISRRSKGVGSRSLLHDSVKEEDSEPIVVLDTVKAREILVEI
jgi:hypothetical protein